MGDKKYKQAHREKGLCQNCSEPVYPGHTMCLEHMRSHNESVKKCYAKNREVYLQKHLERKELRRQTGLCSMCGAPLEDDRFRSCCNCREKLFFERVENAVVIV